jgi:hypothetical protein
MVMYHGFVVRVRQIVALSAILQKKVGSGTHRVTQNLVREGDVLVISIPGEKNPERRSGLGPSEKELPKLCSGVFRHKEPWFY